MSLWGEQISFQGRSGGPGIVSLASGGYSATHVVVDPSNANAIFELRSNADVAKNSGAVMVVVGQWVVPASAAGFYEVFATLDSGTLSAGTTGTWLALSNTRTWARNRTTIGQSQAQITIQIRQIGTTEVLATAVVTFNAVVNDPA